MLGGKKGVFSACLAKRGDRYACTLAKRVSKEAPRDIQFASVLTEDAIKPHFMPLVRSHRKKGHLTTLLDPKDYQFHLLDRPKISERRLHKRMQFLLTDLVDGNIKDYQYKIYLSACEPTQVMTYVVKRTVLDDYFAFSKKHLKMLPTHVSVPELALLAFANAYYPESAKTMLMVQAYDTFLMLLLFQQSTLVKTFLLPAIEGSGETSADQIANALESANKIIGRSIDTLYWNVGDEAFKAITKNTQLGAITHEKIAIPSTNAIIKPEELTDLVTAVGGGGIW